MKHCHGGSWLSKVAQMSFSLAIKVLLGICNPYNVFCVYSPLDMPKMLPQEGIQEAYWSDAQTTLAGSLQHDGAEVLLLMSELFTFSQRVNPDTLWRKLTVEDPAQVFQLFWAIRRASGFKLGGQCLVFAELSERGFIKGDSPTTKSVQLQNGGSKLRQENDARKLSPQIYLDRRFTVGRMLVGNWGGATKVMPKHRQAHWSKTGHTLTDIHTNTDT